MKKGTKKMGPNVNYSTSSADKYYYYILHTLIGTGIFFAFAISLGIFELRSDSISDYLLSTEYLKVTFFTFGISALIGGLSRLISYYAILNPIYDKLDIKIKSFNDMTSGINGLGLSYIVQTFISSAIFAFGLAGILVEKISDVVEMSDLWILFWVFLGIKIIVYAFTKYILKL